VALVIGSIELLGVLDVIPDIDLNLVGYLVVGLFVLTWALALGVWRYGRIEERWSAAVRRP
jgi:nickel/cobalt transporter (NiCoT) family protein